MPPLDARTPPHRAASDDRLPPGASKRSALASAAPASGAPWTFPDRDPVQPPVPGYLKDTYTWAYLRPTSARLLDQPLVVSAILWGNYRRMLRAALGELRPGQRVYQPACVYGDFSPEIARALGPRGQLDVADVVPLQVENCRRKLWAWGDHSMRLGHSRWPDRDFGAGNTHSRLSDRIGSRISWWMSTMGRSNGRPFFVIVRWIRSACTFCQRSVNASDLRNPVNSRSR